MLSPIWISAGIVVAILLVIGVAHTEGGGVGYKADANTTVPLCRYHHQNLHSWGRRSFELAYGVHLEAEAKAVESLFRQLHPEVA